MRVALTGATGFLGAHIAQALLGRGVTVRGVARTPSKGAWLVDRGAEMARADLAEPEAMADAFAGCDAVVANAAMGSFQGDLDAYLATNVQGAENTLAAAAAAGVCRLILISTVAVYRTRLRAMMDESAAPYGHRRRWWNWSDVTTDWRYALSKSRAEAAAWEAAGRLGLEMTSLRPGPIYGSRDPKLTARYLRSHARAVCLAPTVGVPQVHAGDVAGAVVGALETPASAGRAYNLAGPPTSPLQVHRALTRITGRGPVIVPLPLPIWVGYDCARAARELGFRARALEAGLREAVGS